MDKKLIDSAWACLPREFREEVKKIYENTEWERKFFLRDIFGTFNLTSDAEGEEMLTVSRKAVLVSYDYHKSRGHHLTADTLYDLFGSKCLPDEEPKPAEPKFKLGDELVWDKRIIVKVDEIYADGEYLVYSRPGNRYIVEESDLEPYTEPEGKLGMDARGWFRIDTDAIGNKIKVRIPSGVTEPYTEPKDEVVKMKPIKSKVSVYLATKEEDEEFRTLLYENGFMWNGGNALTSRSNWDSDHKGYQIHFVHPDKTVTFLGKRTEDTLTFTEFKKQYFGEETSPNVNNSDIDIAELVAKGYVPDPAKQFDNILKDSFRDHNRLHIAAMAMQGILSNADRMNQYGEIAMRESDSLTALVARNALRYADALLEVAEQK